MVSELLESRIMDLNDTIKQLNNTISNQNELNSSLREDIEGLRKQLADKDAFISNLQAQLDYLKNKVFGSTSEKRSDLIPGQIDLNSLLYGDTEEEAPVIEPEYVEVSGYKKKRKAKATYDELFENLPTRDIFVDNLSEEDKICPTCGTMMESIGTEVIRTEVRYTPPKLERINYIATTYGCPKCKNAEDAPFIKDDDAPPALIPGSYMSESLMSYIMDAKYLMSLPLYRIERELERLGLGLSRTTMAHDIIICSQKYFDPLVEYMHRTLLKRRHLMADETTIQVLKEKDRRPQSKSYVWVLRTGEDGGVPIILYSYTPTRAGKNAAKLLEGAEPGYYLMTDGYQGYNLVPDKLRCCCWAHIRRYWKRAIPKGHEKDYNDPAVQGFMYCNKLFEYERQYKEKGLSIKQKYNRRLKDEKPVIEAFLVWLDKLRPKTGDAIIKAITYTNNCRPYMMNYLKDGACSLSNNLSELAVKDVVIGRKNWLFSDTPDGANASMNIYTLIATARANGLDTRKYINYLLEKRPNKKMSDEELELLSPWNNEVKSICSI